MSTTSTRSILFVYLFIILGLAGLLYSIAGSMEAPSLAPPLILSSQEYLAQEGLSLSENLFSRIHQQPFNLISLTLFFLAILHTFLARSIHLWAVKLGDSKGFWGEILYFMGEVEIVFGIWTIPLLISLGWYYNWNTALEYLSQRNYTEPLFVVVIMALASTKPVVHVAEVLMRFVASAGGHTVRAWWWTILTIGPLVGSFITEPAAMTICAVLLAHQFYILTPSLRLRYATLGLLFTNVSIGGVLTNFAAPPVLMVAHVWNWDTSYMFTHFGVKAILAIILANAAYDFIFKKEFADLEIKRKQKTSPNHSSQTSIPFWITLVHIFLLIWIVMHEHYPVMFIGTFLLFIGFYQATRSFQSPLDLKTPILVGFFLAGLVIHGSLQSWWISPLLSGASFEALMLLSTVLTAFNDNAGITFLATLIPSLSESLKYAIMAGAITGGGLTVIANAPNLSGQSLLSKYFPKGVSAIYLFLGAAFPTLIVGACFYLLRG